MSPRPLALAALLGGLLACRVLPTDDGGAAVDRATPPVAPDALATVRTAIEDPLVGALVAGMSDASSRRQVGEALGALSQAATDAEPGTLDDALLAARREVSRAGAVDDQALRAALSLLLDHADAMIEARRHVTAAADAGETDIRQRSAAP
jgi:hypothetical protein